jgi:hypothetical protein
MELGFKICGSEVRLVREFRPPPGTYKSPAPKSGLSRGPGRIRNAAAQDETLLRTGVRLDIDRFLVRSVARPAESERLNA